MVKSKIYTSIDRTLGITCTDRCYSYLCSLDVAGKRYHKRHSIQVPYKNPKFKSVRRSIYVIIYYPQWNRWKSGLFSIQLQGRRSDFSIPEKTSWEKGQHCSVVYVAKETPHHCCQLFVTTVSGNAIDLWCD